MNIIHPFAVHAAGKVKDETRVKLEDSRSGDREANRRRAYGRDRGEHDATGRAAEQPRDRSRDRDRRGGEQRGEARGHRGGDERRDTGRRN